MIGIIVQATADICHVLACTGFLTMMTASGLCGDPGCAGNAFARSSDRDSLHLCTRICMALVALGWAASLDDKFRLPPSVKRTVSHVIVGGCIHAPPSIVAATLGGVQPIRTFVACAGLLRA